jgi:hypothetical protein
MPSHHRSAVRFAPVLALITVMVFASPGLVALGRTWIGLSVTESAGQVVGTLVKLSHKGWMCKTWEGEMIATGGDDRTIPTHFLFSVRSPAVAQALASDLGRSVLVQYAQHPVPTPSCIGDTDYFIEQATLATRPAHPADGL